jgi:UDP:flavonoid glycosyltransferase YjiC (YdhE family)
MRNHLGNDIPSVNHIKRNTSFILQNGHHSVTYPRPFLPNVAEVACLHCTPAKSLPTDLESFINGSGDAGFIYVSMSSAVKTTNSPKYFFEMLLNVFGSLPYHVLWKWENNITDTYDIPSNVRIERWLPQQDILGESHFFFCSTSKFFNL